MSRRTSGDTGGPLAAKKEKELPHFSMSDVAAAMHDSSQAKGPPDSAAAATTKEGTSTTVANAGAGGWIAMLGAKEILEGPKAVRESLQKLSQACSVVKALKNELAVAAQKNAPPAHQEALMLKLTTAQQAMGLAVTECTLAATESLKGASDAIEGTHAFLETVANVSCELLKSVGVGAGVLVAVTSVYQFAQDVKEFKKEKVAKEKMQDQIATLTRDDAKGNKNLIELLNLSVKAIDYRLAHIFPTRFAASLTAFTGGVHGAAMTAADVALNAALSTGLGPVGPALLAAHGLVLAAKLGTHERHHVHYAVPLKMAEIGLDRSTTKLDAATRKLQASANMIEAMRSGAYESTAAFKSATPAEQAKFRDMVKQELAAEQARFDAYAKKQMDTAPVASRRKEKHEDLLAKDFASKFKSRIPDADHKVDVQRFAQKRWEQFKSDPKVFSWLTTPDKSDPNPARGALCALMAEHGVSSREHLETKLSPEDQQRAQYLLFCTFDLGGRPPDKREGEFEAFRAMMHADLATAGSRHRDAWNALRS